jgi:hypothetical protein
MTPQERDLLTSLFDRLKPVERNPKDEEHRPGRGGGRRRRTAWCSSC